MSKRSSELMTKASKQRDEIAELLATLDEADLRKPCPDEGAGDRPGDSVGAVAAHTAEGYHLLGRFLRAAGYTQGVPDTAHRHGHGHGHGHQRSPAAVSEVVYRLTAAKAPIGLLADLTDEQLDSVPPAGSSRFSDGSRTLQQVLDAVIAHQTAHLETLRRALT